MIAPIKLAGAAKEASPPKIMAVTQPASRAAKTNLQTTAITWATPSWIGLPAYQKAGIIRTQNDTVHATAIPTAPHGNIKRNIRIVTLTSMSPQRNQRSGLPIERWIQLWA